MTKEIEVKFRLAESTDIRAKLLKLRGRLGKCYKQTTYGFFSDDSIKKGIFPRIRTEAGKPVLTVKIRPKDKSEYFERDEYSVIIDSEKRGIEVLKSLGFDRIRKFTKKRQEWLFPSLKVNIDELYFGNFMEIEGSKQRIERMIKMLGFEKKDRITKAYLALEDDYKKSSIK